MKDLGDQGKEQSCIVSVQNQNRTCVRNEQEGDVSVY